MKSSLFWPVAAIALAILSFTSTFAPLSEESCAQFLEKPKSLLREGSDSPVEVKDDSLFCAQNPYVNQLADDYETILSRMDAWLEPSAYQAMIHQAKTNETWKDKWNAFTPFESMSSCQPTERVCVGGECGYDESKITCGLSNLQPGCVVYSIGGNDQWGFELDLLKKTPCSVHTFDCTGSVSRYHPPQHDRLFFHHVCVGTEHKDSDPDCDGIGMCGPTWTMLEIQQNLGHKQVDLYKMDIEGFEWPILESWPELAAHKENKEGSQVALPMQLLVEVHYRTHFAEVYDLYKPERTLGEPFKDPDDIVEFQAHLLRMGYIVVERDDNALCPHCSELTLVRVKC